MADILVVTPVWTKWNDLTIKCAYELTNPTGGKLDYLQLRDGYEQKDDGGRANLVAKQEKARRLALDSGYDYLLFLEEDILPPPNAIELLLSCESDVAYSLYCFRRPPYLWSAFVVMDPDRMIGHPLTVNPSLTKSLFEKGSVIDADGVGFGCTLIKRDVLEKVPFRINYDRPHSSGGYSHSDFYLPSIVWSRNFVQGFIWVVSVDIYHQ